MSDNERFTLYKYYECLVNKLIKIRGSRKYLSDSLENKYATSINRLIDSFEFFDDIAILRGKREDDFAPVKNKDGVDSPKTAKELYEKYWNKMKK